MVEFIEGNEQLSKQAQALIANPENDIYVSEASLCKMTIKIVKMLPITKALI